jgi:uncharacterized membrane protein YhaH (DUF805 family)
MEWYLLVLKKYAVFNGRARRKEYWMFALFNMIIAAVLLVVDKILGTSNIFYSLYCLATLIPSIAVAVRRLHDVGKSGFWYFIALIPLIGWIWLLVLLCMEGQHGQNSYGEDPKF